ncbi:hypothetical protein [Kluyvera ascorbata]
MTATNQQMTSQQLDELMLVAVSMQRDAEKLDERQVAVFAYAIQLVLAEFQNTRQQLAAVVAENAGLKAAVGAVNGIAEECEVNGDEFKYVVEPSEFEALIDLLDETPATDAYQAEVRAQAIRDALGASSDYLDTDCVMDRLDIRYEDAELRTSGAIALHDALVAIANELRQGAA